MSAWDQDFPLREEIDIRMGQYGYDETFRVRPLPDGRFELFLHEINWGVYDDFSTARHRARELFRGLFAVHMHELIQKRKDQD